MTNRSKKDTEWFEGSGNIFADLDLPDAEEHDLKVQIALKLNDAISGLACSQTEIAKKLGIKQPHVSQLVNYKLHGFSVERLLLFIVKLGHSLSIQVSAEATSKPTLNVTTHAPGWMETTACVGEIYNAIASNWIDTHTIEGRDHRAHRVYKPTLSRYESEPWVLASPVTERLTAEFVRPLGTLQ